MTDPIERAAMALLPHGWAHATEALRGVKRNEARAALLAFLDAPEFREIVARAMCDELGLHADDWSEDLRGERVYVWQKEADTAQAAIAACARRR